MKLNWLLGDGEAKFAAREAGNERDKGHSSRKGRKDFSAGKRNVGV